MSSSSYPPNYVAGIGRGATGFTTRADIGLACSSTSIVSGLGLGRGCGKGPEEDEFEVNNFEREAEADEFEVNNFELEAEAGSHGRASNPNITEQFADLKRKLGNVSAEEWESIPEVSDYSKRNKKMKKRLESFVPIPDTLLEKAIKEQEHVLSLEPNSSTTDLTAVGEGRGTMLSMKLDRLSNSVTELTVVDPKGYVTDLNSMRITSFSENMDTKRARLLFKSITKTNPKHPPGWIGAARMEEAAGDMHTARQLIQKGCKECPKNEDVWLEACKLVNSNKEEARAVIAMGVKAIPNSVKLWMQAAELEQDDVKKSWVLRKGLEHVPDSVRLWKAAVELANEEDARVLLSRAVECCPFHIELWLALARLEMYEGAKKVLKRARTKLSKEPAIWITAAKLEQANGNTAKVGEIIERGIQALQGQGLVIDREDWMKEAEAAERAGSVVTRQAIIQNTVGIGVEEEDLEMTWVADVEECKERGSIETARAIYDHALSVFRTKTNESVWLKAAQLEKSHGTRESLDALLTKAVIYMPQAEVLWLMGAKEKSLLGDVTAARAILREAHASIPNSEEIWLAASKLEFENQEPERARMLLAKARDRGATERVWMESAILERELGNSAEERRLLEDGLKRFPLISKLWLMLGQLEERLGNLKQAKAAYGTGLKHCPNCNPLWLLLAELEEKMNGLNRARAILTMARKKNPHNPELWLAAGQAESRHGNKKEADFLMAKALQECPTSEILRDSVKPRVRSSSQAKQS